MIHEFILQSVPQTNIEFQKQLESAQKVTEKLKEQTAKSTEMTKNLLIDKVSILPKLIGKKFGWKYAENVFNGV